MRGGVAGGLVTGDRQQDDEPRELLRAQRFSVDIGGDELADDVVGRALAALLGQVPGVTHHLGVGHPVRVLVLRIVVAHHLVGPVEQLAAVLLWHPEQFGDRLQRQLGSHLLDEVATAGLLGLVDNSLGPLDQRLAQRLHCARGETAEMIRRSLSCAGGSVFTSIARWISISSRVMSPLKRITAVFSWVEYTSEFLEISLMWSSLLTTQ